MESECPDLSVIFLPGDQKEKCVVFSAANNFLFQRDLLKDHNFFPEELYASFFSPFPPSYLEDCIKYCTSIALKQTIHNVSKSPITVIACGGESGYKELGEFRL